ncbi:hypothetical protein GCM10017783_03610 [Deinococcus piscis]|uniref:Endonuclease/exonuclease/phosphatase domain-containing protein n=1 Tax=Deinococcus piscis TaxID=394230 RepID=A0ABQ3JY19_9DEIO|nr:endonuclease/exonuclease/phosphatase family protein [Deinococcus piscis]GHF94994.1 hypothetical protein GCM10017783_03610 [Deinococcus piscis]
MERRQPSWLSRLAWAYLATVLLVWGLGEWVGERTVPTLLLAYAPPAFLLALWPLLTVATLFQRAARLPVLLAALAGLGYAGLTLHLPQPPQTGDLTLLTYNIARGTQGSAEALAAQIRAQDADIVTLQETNGWDAEFTPELLRQLPGYQAAQTGAGGELVTLSRLPILGSREVLLPETTRRFLVTAVQTPQGKLNVVNVHFSTVLVSGVLKGQVIPTRNRRGAQLDILLRETAQMPQVVVAGDFNTPPRGRVYRALSGQFVNAWDAAGQGFGYSFPAQVPVLRIDHVFARGLQPVQAEVLDAGGSDHRGLRTVLRPD